MSDRGRHHFRHAVNEDGSGGGVVGERSEGDTSAQRRKYFDEAEAAQRGERVAGVVIDSGGMSVVDTQGSVVYDAQFPTDVMRAMTEEEQENYREELRRKAATECHECGIGVVYGAIYCLECAPYGGWHWLKYFSPIRWARK